MRLERVGALLGEREVASAAELCLFVQDREDPLPLGLEEEIERRLVVFKLNLVDRDPLDLVLFLLGDKDALVEKALELLVGEIDTHLLERIFLEDLEPEDVKDTDGARLLVGRFWIDENHVAQLEDPRKDLVENLQAWTHRID